MLRLLLGALDRREILQRPFRRGRRRIAEAQTFEALSFEGFAGLFSAAKLFCSAV